MSEYTNKKRILAGIVLFFLTVQLCEMPIVQAAPIIFGDTTVETEANLIQNSQAKDHIGIIAVLVESSLMENQQVYDGLKKTTDNNGNLLYTNFLKDDTLPERIRRYAIDAQSSQDLTKSVIITIDKNESTDRVRTMLERLYLEGDGTKDEINKLVGVVVIGDVPLPVVNKQGNRFASLFPYTDFTDPVYIFDQTRKEFVPNTDSKKPGVEIWHGVIKAPKNGEEGNTLLAGYFDKNHLYHSNVPEFSKFNGAPKTYKLPANENYAAKVQPGTVIKQYDILAQSTTSGRVIVAEEDGSVSAVNADSIVVFTKQSPKIFVADLINELKNMNRFGFNSYQRYLEYAEELVYLRYNKHLAAKFFEQVQDKVADDGLQTTANDGGQQPVCDKECVIQKNSRNLDFDQDGYSNGYELEIGSSIAPGQNKPTDPKDPWSFPLDFNSPGPFGFMPRLIPLPGDYVSQDDGTKLDYPDAPIDPNNQNGANQATKDSFNSLPDIQSIQIINNFVSKYVGLFDKFLGLTNDWTHSTGRYQDKYDKTVEINGKAVQISQSDVDTMAALISKKDEYTIQYLKSVNDSVEKKIDDFIEDNPNPDASKPNRLYENILMLEKADLSGTVKLFNLVEFDLEKKDFINTSNHVYQPANGPAVNTLFFNGTPVSAMTSIADCMLYRGSNDGTGKNSILSIALRLFDPKTAGDPNSAENQKYAGCFANNAKHPEYCFPSRAELPLYDINGTKEVQPGTVPDSATNFRACFDFKEKTRYDDYEKEVDEYQKNLAQAPSEDGKNSVPKPGSPYENATNIILYENTILGVKVTFADVLNKYGLADGQDNNGDGIVDNEPEGDIKFGIPTNDWKQIGERLFKKQGTLEFKNNPFPKVDSLKLVINNQAALDAGQVFPKFLKSVIYHKEPTAETIAAQLAAGGYAMTLPTDNPRYVVFQDRSSEKTFRKIVYPNLFQVASYDDYVKSLANIESNLITIATVGNVNPINISGSLVKLISGQVNEFSGTNKFTLEVTSKQAIEDALAWRNMNIDEKHTWVLQNYLNKNAETGISKSAAGYEAMYLVGDSDESGQALNLSFNGDSPIEDPGLPPEPTPTPATQPDGSVNGGGGNNASDGIDIEDWFEHLGEWLKDTTAKSLTPTFQAACVVPDLDAAPSDNGGNSGSKPQNPPVVEGPKNTTVLSVEAEKTVLKAGSADTVKIKVEGINGSAVLQTGDNDTQVDIVVSKPDGKEIARITSLRPQNLIQGSAEFVLQSTDEIGTFTVKAVSPNKPNLPSNTVSITSTKRAIRLVSYTKSTQTVYQEKTEVNYVVQDENGAILAEIDGQTGLMTSKDANYVVNAATAQGSLPVRLVLQNKQTLETVASVFFVANVTQSIIVDDGSANYLASYKNLSGVHIQHIGGSAYSLKKIAENEVVNGGGANLFKVENGVQKKVGILDAKGNLYLDSSLGLRVKEVGSDKDPVVFVVYEKGDGLNAIQGKALYELYISPKFSKIAVVPEVGQGTGSGADSADGNETAKAGAGTTSEANAWLPSAHAQEDAPKNSESFTTGTADQDNDGVKDIEEVLLGTDLQKADTDSDGFSDGAELASGFDPLKANTALFKDLDLSSEGYADILKLYRRGVLKGYSDGTFKPDQSITREEFTKVNLGTVCLNCTQFTPSIKASIDALYNTHKFPDQNFTGELLYCVEESRNRNIISGYQGGTNKGYFLPTNTISRAEATKVILETLRQQDPNALQFAQESLANKPWFYNYVLTAQAAKIYPIGRFKEIDSLSEIGFNAWFTAQAANSESEIMKWLNAPITRREFAIMASRIIEKNDCFMKDIDNDGIPDSLEKYVFGTDANTNDSGSVFDKNGADSGNNSGNGTDSTDNTNGNNQPKDPNADSDGGGVIDTDELIKGTDILDPSDDKPTNGYNEGVYAAGKNIVAQTVAVVENEAQIGQVSTLVFGDELPADGTSKMFLRAEVLDDNGEVDTNENGTTIQFKAAANSKGNFATILPLAVQTVNGVAETEVKSTTKAGEFIAEALVKGKNLPSDQKSIFVVPLAPKTFEVTSTLSILKSGGLSNTAITASLKDEHGNLNSNGVYQATFSVEGPGELDASTDEDLEQPGVQITTVTGTYDLKLSSRETPGDIKVLAKYQPVIETADALNTDANGVTPTQNNSQTQLQSALLTAHAAEGDVVMGNTTIQSLADLKVALTLVGENVLPADYKSATGIEASVVNANNQVVTNFNGTAHFTVLNENLGSIVNGAEQKVVNGKAKAVFQTKNLAGNAVISVTIDGFDTKNITIQTLPKESKKIVLESNSDTLEADPNTVLEIRGRLYDTDNNFAFNDSATQVEFSLTDATKPFALLEGNNPVTAKNGVVSILVRPQDFTGPIHVIAKSAAFTDAASLQLKSVKRFNTEEWLKTAPNVLFASMLGSGFGNIFQENSAAGSLVFAPQGVTQSAISLLSDPKPALQLAQIDAKGKVTVPDEDAVTMHLIPSEGKLLPPRIAFEDRLTKESLAEMFVVMKPQAAAVIASTNPDLQDGILVEKLVELDDYSLKQTTEGVSILKDGNEAVQVSNNGAIHVVSSDFSVEYLSEAASGTDGAKSGFTLKVIDKGVEVASVRYANSNATNVQELPASFDFDAIGSNVNLQSGVYVHRLSNKPNVRFHATYSGSSSADARGMALVDTAQDMPKSQAPGLSYVSLEASADEQGIGFEGDNKHMLLFAAGNSVGEANEPYSSEIGIVLGDPTVRINNTVNKSATGFTQDIGKEILTGDKDVQELTMIDYNNDGLKDVLVSFADGEVKLLQNNNAHDRFEDRGTFLEFAQGLQSLTTGDFNHDGQTDLIIAGQNSCQQGQVCIDLYENHHGQFVRKPLNLESFTEKNRIYMLRGADMNNDSYPDLVTSDDTGAIRVFWNKNGQLATVGKYVGSLGLHIDNVANLKGEVLVAYDGMPQNDPAKTDDDQAFVDLDDQSFVYLDVDPALVTSEKRAADLTDPKNILARQDLVEYSIILKNSSGNTLNNLKIADVFPSNMTVDPAGIKCEDCVSGENVQTVDSGTSTRPKIITGLNLAPGQSRKITYRGQVNTTPEVRLMLGQNLSKDYQPQDGFMDIGATPEGNDTGRMTYFYSLNQDPINKEINYQPYTSPPPTSDPLPVQNPAGGQGQPKKDDFADNNGDGIPDNLDQIQKDNNVADEDGDGLPDLFDNLNAGLDSAAGAVQGAINALTCGQGCIPMPINFAFLAPGAINVMGVPGGFDPGLPIFAWGVPSIVPVWPPSPYQGSLGGRIYLSPTTTLGLGTGICLGPYLAGQCFAFAVPLSALSDKIAKLCTSLAKNINEVMASANNAIQSVGNSAIFTNGETADSSGKQSTGGMTGSTSLGNYTFKASASTNFRIPAFPAVITKWFEDQTNEIVNKLMDLPDFYLVLPDPTSLVTTVLPQEGSLQGSDQTRKRPFTFPTLSSSPLKDENGNYQVGLSTPSKILSYINSIPLVQIEAREVGIKIPILTPAEIAKIQHDLQQWLIDERQEVNRTLALWCGSTYQIDEQWKLQGVASTADSQYVSFCEKLLLDTSKIRKGVERNLEVLEKYKNLPRKVLEWRNMFSKYIYQVICYLDAVTEVVVGHVQKLQNGVTAWIEMIRKARQILATWKALVDIVIDYQTSCDKCTSSRFTLLELLLRVFAAIPSPQVIPFPKWPDIYMDFSGIQTGLKIVWPDVKFIPERIIFPQIPRITLPDLPTLTLNLPTIPVLPDPPNLPELPDLPGLTIPELPSLPLPPKIPELKAEIKATIQLLTKILKILCLLKKGLLPIPELSLKTQIESLTERPLTPLLPVDLGTKLNLPTIKYNSVDRIEVIGTLNFKLSTEFIYQFVQKVADDWNSLPTDLVRQVNEFSNNASKAVNDATNSLQTDINGSAPGNNVDINLESKDPNRLVAEDLSVFDTSTMSVKTISEAQINAMLEEFKVNDPLLGSLLNDYENSLEDLEKAAKEEEAAGAKADPEGTLRVQAVTDPNAKVEDIHLKATQRYFNTAQASADAVAQIKTDRLLAGKPQSDIEKRLVGLRDRLIAYSDEQQNLSNQLGDINNLEAVGKYLAEAPSLTAYLPKSSNTSAVESETFFVDNGFNTANRDDDVFSAKEEIKEWLNDSGSSSKFQAANPTTATDIFTNTLHNDLEKRLLALASTEIDVPATEGNASLDVQQKGIFVVNQDLGINERLINYTVETDRPTKLLFLDMDNDSDEEIMYSMGSNVYVKENYKVPYVPTYLGYDPEIKALNDYLPAASAVQNFQVTTQNHNEVQVNWNEQTAVNAAAVSGYEITARLTPDAYEQNLGGISYRFIMPLAGKLPAVIENANGDLEMQATSVVDEVTGKAVDPTAQKLANGITVESGRWITSKGGSAGLRFADNSYITINPGERVFVQSLDDEQNPSAQLTLKDGFYYAKIRSFGAQGFSTASPMIVLSPSICNDKQAPLPNAGASERDVPLFNSLTIDASSSIDPNGEIIKYYLDTDPTVDSDGNGDPADDINVGGDANPVMNLGPFNEVKDLPVVLNLLDSALNRATQKILIHVIVPKVNLDASSATEPAVTGSIDPAQKDMPITVIRDRGGIKSVLKTPSANANGKYLTNEQGQFTVNDLNLKDTIIVKNEKGEVVAEINPLTNQIIVKDPNYILEVLPAELPLLPTRIVIKQKSDGKILSTIFLVPDLNTDVTLDPADLAYTTASVALFKGVHIKDLNGLDDFAFNKLLADDAVYPGGLEIVETGTKKRAAVMDSGGNFYKLDNRLSLQLKSASSLEEPLVIEIVYTPTGGGQPQVIGEFYIAVKSNNVKIVPLSQFKALVYGDTAQGPLFDGDADGLPDEWEQVYGLNPKDSKDGLEDSDGDGLNNKEEFQAGSNPQNPDTNNDGFSDSAELSYGRRPGESITVPYQDIDANNPYAEDIFKLWVRRIFEGIPGWNDNIFEPAKALTRAEFADMMLKVFCIVPRPEAYTGPSSFNDISYTAPGKDPWFYAAVKEAYFQGFVTGYKAEIDTNTGLTPFKPTETISRAEATKVILEALQHKGVIDMGDVPVQEPYYAPYMQIAQDLKPYIKQQSYVKEPFLLTKEEAAKPEENLSREAFIAMADRVLVSFDCTVIDTDGDGMPDYYEKKNGLNPSNSNDANLDPDGDGAKNLDEFKHGTNPQDADTDKGGVKDGDEITKGTNPLNAADDPIDKDGDGLADKDEVAKYKTDPGKKDSDGGGVDDGTEVLYQNTNPLNGADDNDKDGDKLSDIDEPTKYKTDPNNPDSDGGGIDDGAEVARGTDPLNPADDLIDPRKDLAESMYIIQEECLTCPCPVSIDHTADLVPGDLIFAIIANDNNSKIFSKSNVVKREK